MLHKFAIAFNLSEIGSTFDNIILAYLTRQPKCTGCVMKTTNYWDQQTHDDRPQQTVHTK